MDLESGPVQGLDKGVVELQRRLSAGDADSSAVASGLQDLRDDFPGVHLPVAAVVRIAERTLQVTAGEAQEHHRRPGPEPFSLQGVEYFVDPVH